MFKFSHEFNVEEAYNRKLILQISLWNISIMGNECIYCDTTMRL